MGFFEQRHREFMGLCQPAQLYLALSMVAIIMILVQNLNATRKYCFGMYSCHLDYSNIFVFVVKILYVAIWTIIINSLCKTKWNKLAWAIVLAPIILMFLSISMFIFSKKR